MILYGRSEQLQNLDKRRADITGDISHDEAVDEQNQYMEQQDIQESEHKRKRQAQNQ